MIQEYSRQAADDFEARWKRFESGQEFFKDEDLVYSAYAHCPCGSGLAHPKNCGPHHQWTRSLRSAGRPPSLFLTTSDTNPDRHCGEPSPRPAGEASWVRDWGLRRAPPGPVCTSVPVDSALRAKFTTRIQPGCPGPPRRASSLRVRVAIRGILCYIAVLYNTFM